MPKSPKNMVIDFLRGDHEVTRVWGQSLYAVNRHARIYLRESKSHARQASATMDKFWFGLPKEVMAEHTSQNLFIALVCSNAGEVVVLPADELHELLIDSPIGHDTRWHLHIFKVDGRYELAIGNKGRYDVTSYLNSYDFTPKSLRIRRITQIRGLVRDTERADRKTDIKTEDTTTAVSQPMFCPERSERKRQFNFVKVHRSLTF